ncbi:MAG: hypothetical protein U0K86_02035 [Agathobacter sp.]|nr:hypothetical protein [Agathobacter sp.]
MIWFALFLFICAIVLYVMLFKFAYQCKRRQKADKNTAQIYIGQSVVEWIVGVLMLCVASVMELFAIIFLVSNIYYSMFVIVIGLLLTVEGLFFLYLFGYGTVFLYENKIHYYKKRKIESITAKDIQVIMVQKEYGTYVFMDKDKNKYFSLDKNRHKKMLDYITQEIQGREIEYLRTNGLPLKNQNDRLN